MLNKFFTWQSLAQSVFLCLEKRLNYYLLKDNFQPDRYKDELTRGFMNSDDLQRLVTLSMPYGKYKGRVIADLPGQYLNWFAREGFPPNELGRLLALMQEIDHNGLSPLLEPLRK